jgi:hypothetical protein
MADKISWETNWDSTLVRAKSDAKPIFLDFFNPQ